MNMIEIANGDNTTRASPLESPPADPGKFVAGEHAATKVGLLTSFKSGKKIGDGWLQGDNPGIKDI